MRQILKFSVLILALATAGSVAASAQAAPDTTPTNPHRGEWRHHGPNPEFETKMLTKRLNLTAEQAAQVEPILAASQESMKSLKPAAGTQPDFKAIQTQRKAIMEDTKQKLDAVFTPEQQEKFAKMHEHHGPHGNWSQKPSSTPAAS